MKRAAANAPAVCGSLGYVLPRVGFDVQHGMPAGRLVVGHLRPLRRSNLNLSRGSAVV